MPYKIVTTGELENQIIRIENENTKSYIEIFALGAILNKYVIETDEGFVNCIDAYQSPQDVEGLMTKRFQGAKLSPFVCRLTNGTFSFEDHQYKVGKHFDGKSAIHGLVYDETFTLTNQYENEDGATVELTKTVKAEEYGFPFHYTLKILYTLTKNDAVKIETIVTNDGDTTMPLNDGWHPYFQLDEFIDDTLLQFRSKEMAVFDASLLPTGEFIEYKEFQTLKPVGKVELDNSFTIDELGSPALVLASESKKLKLSVSPKEGYPILQIYIPPARNSMAVENLTSLPDSFNNKIGLITLKPNESKSFVTEYHLQKLN